MRKILITSCLFLAVFGGVFFYHKNVHCVWCPTYPCYGAGSCGECQCLQTGVGAGKCVSLQYYEDVKSKKAP